MAGDDHEPQSQNFSGLEVFKGTAYGPANHLSKRRNRYRMMNQQELEKYDEKVTQSDGFDVDDCTGSLSGRIIPIPCPSDEFDTAILVAEYAIEQHYDDGGKRLRFVSLDKANIQPVSGEMYYLTFTAKDTTDKSRLKVYRAKVWSKAALKGLQLMSFEEYQTTVPHEKAVLASAGGALVAFTALVKKIKSENPFMTHAKARNAASKKWKLLLDSEKQILISEQA